MVRSDLGREEQYETSSEISSRHDIMVAKPHRTLI